MSGSSPRPTVDGTGADVRVVAQSAPDRVVIRIATADRGRPAAAEVVAHRHRIGARTVVRPVGRRGRHEPTGQRIARAAIRRQWRLPHRRALELGHPRPRGRLHEIGTTRALMSS